MYSADGALATALRPALRERMIGLAEDGRWSDDDLRWRDWMVAAQDGDKASYERLLRELRSVIRGYLIRRFGPADFIDDVAQECLLSVHAGRHTYDATRPFRAWLFTIVRHRTIDFLRRQRGAWLQREATVAADDVGTPAAIETISEAAWLLRQLKPEQREIIVLIKYLGLSAEESGQRLGVSVASVRVRLHRALAATRKLVRRDERCET